MFKRAPLDGFAQLELARPGVCGDEGCAGMNVLAGRVSPLEARAQSE